MESKGPILDLKGSKCPLPALLTRKALKRLRDGDVLIVECTDPLAPIDIAHLVREIGDTLEQSFTHAGVYIFHIRKRSEADSAKQPV